MARPEQSAKNKKNSKIITGSGAKKKTNFSFWSNAVRIPVFVIFAASFSFIGYLLLKGSSAQTPETVPLTVTVASWNAKIDNKNNDATEVKSVMTNADVIGLQEIHLEKQRNRIESLLKTKTYDGYPSTLPNNNKDSAASSLIIWKQDLFDKVTAGTTGKVSSSFKVGKTALRSRYVTWVKLRSKTTGREFYVVNTHMVKNVDNAGLAYSDKAHGEYVSHYASHMQKLVTLVKKLQRDGAPVFVTGDFAVDYRTDNKATTIFPKTALGALDLKSNWGLTDLTGIAPTARSYGDKGTTRLIDYVFAPSSVTDPITSIGTSSHGSDHFPVYLTVTLPVVTYHPVTAMLHCNYTCDM